MNSLGSQFKGMLHKAAEIGGTLALAAALILASSTPGNGAYEVNIYRAYTLWFWLLVAASICLGLIAMLTEIVSTRQSYRWLYGFLVVVAANTLILLLPYLRDYGFVDQWDPANHFSYALSVLEYGHPDIENFYPVSHVMAAVASLITGLDLQLVVLLFPVLFYFIYLTNTAVLAWALDLKPQARGIMMVLATPLAFHTFGTRFRPVHFAVCMLPFFVGWLWWTRSREADRASRVVLVLLIAFLPFLHPLGVFSAAGVVIMFVIILGWQRVRGLGAPSYRRDPRSFVMPLSILGVAWLTWFMSFRIFGTSLRRLILGIASELEGAHSFAGYVLSAQRAALTLDSILSLVSYNYGPTILYLGFAGGVLAWDFARRARRREEIPVGTSALLAFAAVVGFLAVLSLFRDLITASPLRYSNFAVACVPALVGGSFYDSFLDRSASAVSKTLTSLSCIVLLAVVFGASVLAMLGSYPSPLTGQPNLQLSYAQQAGHAFLIDKIADDDTAIYSPFGGAFVLSSVLNIDEQRQLREESYRWWIGLAPAHFGYEPDELGLEFHNPGYLWVTGHEKAYYTEVWPEGGRFTPQDFATLESDSNWHQVYMSGDFTLWRRRSDD